MKDQGGVFFPPDGLVPEDLVIKIIALVLRSLLSK